jgi:hypothetical protein
MQIIICLFSFQGKIIIVIFSKTLKKKKANLPFFSSKERFWKGNLSQARFLERKGKEIFPPTLLVEKIR